MRPLLQRRGGDDHLHAAFVVERVRGKDDGGLIERDENRRPPFVLAKDGLMELLVGRLAQAADIRGDMNRQPASDLADIVRIDIHADIQHLILRIHGRVGFPT